MKTEKFLGSQNKLLNMQDGSANFIISLVLMFVIQFLFVILLAVAKIDYESFTSAFIGTCIICLVNELSFILTPIGYSKVKDTNYFKNINFKFDLSFVKIVLCVLIALATILFSSPIANWFVELILKTGFNMSNIASMEIKSVTDLILGLIFLSLLPAVVEEILFRGVIAKSFKSKGIIFAIFMSAFLFAIMHGTPIQLVHQFVIGVVCCIAYFITDRILAPIIIHFTNNAVSIIGSYILYKQNVTEQEMNVVFSIILVIVGAIALVLLLYFLLKIASKDNEKANTCLTIKGKIAILSTSEYETQLILEENKTKEEKLAQLQTPEQIEIYNLTEKQTVKQKAHIQRRSLIYAIAVGLVIWAMQTLMCYL